jgi:hypothetical protein
MESVFRAQDVVGRGSQRSLECACHVTICGGWAGRPFGRAGVEVGSGAN